MTETTERAVLAGGCFWGMQDLIRKLPGVISTRVGYTGGDVPNATYRNHGTHAEAIEIIFDPAATSYRELLEFFFQIHDPTTKNRQGNDVGLSYRSAIYYTSDEQRRVADDTIADVDASGLWPGKVVTEVEPAGPFWEAEPEHQDYLERYPERLHLPLRAAELEAAPPPGRLLAAPRPIGDSGGRACRMTMRSLTYMPATTCLRSPERGRSIQPIRPSSSSPGMRYSRAARPLHLVLRHGRDRSAPFRGDTSGRRYRCLIR